MQMNGDKKVEVIYHLSVVVPESEVYAVKEWTERFGYMLGDGWAFNQTVAEYITIDGMNEWQWNNREKDE